LVSVAPSVFSALGALSPPAFSAAGFEVLRALDAGALASPVSALASAGFESSVFASVFTSVFASVLAEAAVELTRLVRFTGLSSWISSIVFCSHFFAAQIRDSELNGDAEGLS
jgi:hypothetical protein